MLTLEQMNQLFDLMLPQSVKDAVVAFVNSILANQPQGGFSQAEVDAAVAAAVSAKQAQILASLLPILQASESSLEAQATAIINS